LEPLLDFAVRSGQLPPMIMVWANCGHNTKYMDAAMYGVLMIETTIIRELIPHIDATYRTTASRAPRKIAISGDLCESEFGITIRGWIRWGNWDFLMRTGGLRRLPRRAIRWK
jgi:hypothetical protein